MNTLPDELILQISSYFLGDPDISSLRAYKTTGQCVDLIALASACRRFRNMVWPLTFHRVSVNETSLKSGCFDHGELRHAKGSCVVLLTLGFNGITYESETLPKVIACCDQMINVGVIYLSVAARGGGFGSQWRHHVQTLELLMDAMKTLPQLSHFSFYTDYAYPGQIVCKQLTRWPREKLRTVELRGPTEASWTSAAGLWFRLARRITVEFNLPEIPTAFLTALATWPNLEELHVRIVEGGVCQPSEDLPELLQYLKSGSLRKLTLDSPIGLPDAYDFLPGVADAEPDLEECKILQRGYVDIIRRTAPRIESVRFGTMKNCYKTTELPPLGIWKIERGGDSMQRVHLELDLDERYYLDDPYSDSYA